ncbi:MAG: signal peptidase I [Fimbriimonas sp.]
MPPIDALLPLAQLTTEQKPMGAREIIDHLARTPLSQVVLFVVALTVVRLAIFPVLSKTVAHKRGGGYKTARFVNEVLDAFVYAGVFVFMLIRPFGVQAFLIPSGSMWPTLYVNDFIVANKAIYRYSDPKAGDIVVFRPPVSATQNRPEQIDPKTGDVKVDFIKRCIGTPGQVIELKEGQLFRDNQRVEEPYKEYSDCTDTIQVGDCQNFRPFTDEEKDNITKASFKLVKYKGRLIPLNYTNNDANSGYPMGNFPQEKSPYSVADEFEIEDQNEARRLRDLPAEPVPPGFYLMMGDNRNGSFDGRGWGLVPRKDIIGRSEFIWLPFSRWRATR